MCVYNNQDIYTIWYKNNATNNVDYEKKLKMLLVYT